MYSSSQQIPIRPNVLSVQVPSVMNYVGQNDSSNVARDGVENGTFSQAESLVNPSKKLENDMLLLGKKIKHHEENIKYLRTHKNSLDDVITDLQVTLGKYHSSSTPKIKEEDLSNVQSEEATVGNIMKHEKSAAAIMCQLKRHRNQATHMKDVLGVVATLGKVNDDNLSRLLSEYLGLDMMLALVCMTYDDVKALESYDKEGSVSKSSGLHGLGAAIGQTLEGRFNVICLENLRPYVGEFMPNDPQRRLALLKPTLPNGESPAGLIGFAVNMIHINSPHLFCLTTDGNGLRETLFYTLFSRLQVYRTRTDMLQALPCIFDGAISLDGGMIRSTGVFSLGTREKMDVKFAISPGVPDVPETYVEVEKQMKELKWKRERMMEDMQREEAMLAHVKYNFEVKKQEFLGFMAQSSPYTMQYPMQATQNENESNLFVHGKSEFFTDMVFKERQDLVEFVQNVGRSLGYIIVIKRSTNSSSGKIPKIQFQCDRGGTYKGKKISTRNTSTKKINCPFRLKGKYVSVDDCWKLRVICETHNHDPALHMEDHPYPRRLSENEARLVEDLSANNVKPRDILSTLKKRNTDNVSTLKTIYNARQKFRMMEKAGRTFVSRSSNAYLDDGYTLVFPLHVND